MKRIIAMIVCLMMVLSTCALAERGGMGGPGGGMGGGMTQNDEEIQAILDANASKFQQFTFTDEETSNSLEYSLFIPEDYDASKSFHWCRKKRCGDRRAILWRDRVGHR